MMDRSTVLKFEEELTQLAAVLEPFARSIKCLESSYSTLSNVYIYWFAVLARFQDIFKSNETVSGVGLPSSVIKEITSVLNGRYAEMFNGDAGQVYLAAFFLDIHNSDVLLHRPAQLLTKTWKSQHISSSADLLPDQDLRQALPAYTKAGAYLVKLLGRVYNKDPDAPLFARYSSWSQIEIAFRNQLVLFTRGLSPFHQVPKPSAERAYWESMCTVPTAELLAHLGVILTSIVPNSMAEQRSMSTITKLNSPDHASQKVSTLIDMVTIPQHYKREENRNSLSSRSLRPTARFADLAQSISGVNISNEAAPKENGDVLGVLERLDGELTLPDEECEASSVARGSPHQFEAEANDGISLSSELLSGMISDHSSIVIKRSHSSEPLSVDARPPQKRQRVDVSSLMY
ncbi:hypothetical protein FRC08_016996 [Ceratobasidium sp. 394]|nr:hypothetical protein FRC08_016996 [Ceratobasidium sp. 394]KAG9099728.1 hypothetical protein FS749_000521 [Ceratobasidium sp. UAMH 11750]